MQALRKNARRTLCILMAALLCAALLPTAALAAVAQASATTMRVAGTTGTVTVKNASGQNKSVFNNMQLYNGYTVETALASYATLSLDGSKAIRLDAATKVELRQNTVSKSLEVFISKGRLIFDVDESLADDESMNIRTANLVCGIRGTDGVVEAVDPNQTLLTMLTGTTFNIVTDPLTGETMTGQIGAGLQALFWSAGSAKPTESAKSVGIETLEASTESIPGFALVSILEQQGKAQKIAEATSGKVDVTHMTPDEARARMLAEEQERAAEEQTRKAAFEKQLTELALGKKTVVIETWGEGGKPIQEGPYTPVVTVYTVTFETGGGSEVPPQRIAEGQRAVRPDDPTRSGYTFEYWELDGERFDFSAPITKDTTLVAVWTAVSPQTYAVVIDENIEHGTVTADKSSAAEGETVTLTVTPEEGYGLTSLYYVEEGESGSTEISGNSFSMPAANVTVYAVFLEGAATYSLTADKDISGGTVTATVGGKAVTEAAAGTTVTLAVEPDEDYAAVEVYYLGEGDSEVTTVEAVNGVYSFPMPAKNVVYGASFAQLHTLTLQDSDGCTVTVDGAALAAEGTVKLPAGKLVTVAVTPLEGWKFDDSEDPIPPVMGCATENETKEVAFIEDEENPGVFTFEMFDEDVTLWTNMVKLYDLTLGSSEHGTVAANGTALTADTTLSVGEGDTVSLTVTKDDGWEISEVSYLLEGASAATPISYTEDSGYSFRMPGGNASVSVTYVEGAYTVSLSEALAETLDTAAEEFLIESYAICEVFRYEDDDWTSLGLYADGEWSKFVDNEWTTVDGPDPLKMGDQVKLVFTMDGDDYHAGTWSIALSDGTEIAGMREFGSGYNETVDSYSFTMPGSDVTVTGGLVRVMYCDIEQPVTGGTAYITSVGGLATPANTTGTVAAEDDEVELELTPTDSDLQADAYFYKYNDPGSPLYPIDEVEGVFKFRMVTHDMGVVVVPCFGYALTLDNASPSLGEAALTVRRSNGDAYMPISVAQAGDTVRVTPSPSSGSVEKQPRYTITEGSETVSRFVQYTDGIGYEFEMPACDSTVTVGFGTAFTLSVSETLQEALGPTVVECCYVDGEELALIHRDSIDNSFTVCGGEAVMVRLYCIDEGSPYATKDVVFSNVSDAVMTNRTRYDSEGKTAEDYSFTMPAANVTVSGDTEPMIPLVLRVNSTDMAHIQDCDALEYNDNYYAMPGDAVTLTVESGFALCGVSFSGAAAIPVFYAGETGVYSFVMPELTQNAEGLLLVMTGCGATDGVPMSVDAGGVSDCALLYVGGITFSDTDVSLRVPENQLMYLMMLDSTGAAIVDDEIAALGYHDTTRFAAAEPDDAGCYEINGGTESYRVVFTRPLTITDHLTGSSYQNGTVAAMVADNDTPTNLPAYALPGDSVSLIFTAPDTVDPNDPTYHYYYNIGGVKVTETGGQGPALPLTIERGYDEDESQTVSVYSFTMPENSVILDGTFRMMDSIILDLDVDGQNNAHGTATLDAVTIVRDNQELYYACQGEPLHLVLTPDDGYGLTSLSGNVLNAATNLVRTKDGNNSCYDFVMGSPNYATLNVEFEALHTVNVSALIGADVEISVQAAIPGLNNETEEVLLTDGVASLPEYTSLSLLVQCPMVGGIVYGHKNLEVTNDYQAGSLYCEAFRFYTCSKDDATAITGTATAISFSTEGDITLNADYAQMYEMSIGGGVYSNDSGIVNGIVMRYHDNTTAAVDLSGQSPNLTPARFPVAAEESVIMLCSSMLPSGEKLTYTGADPNLNGEFEYYDYNILGTDAYTCLMPAQDVTVQCVAST